MMVFVTRVTGAPAPPPPPPPGDTTAPDFFSGSIYVLGLNQTDYYMGWTAGYDAVGVAEYEYSLNNGETWSSAGTAAFVHVTGRTAGATDQVKVRARDAAGNVSSVLSKNITLPSIGAPEVIVSIIGTGGDYATPPLWAADGPTIAGNSSLVAANKILEGWLLDQEFVGVPLNSDTSPIGGMVTSATQYRHLTAYPGASFKDKASRRSRALRYDGTAGASMRLTSSYNLPVVSLHEGYARCSRLQVSSTGNGTSTFGGFAVHTSAPDKPTLVEDMIMQSGSADHVLATNYGLHITRNCAVIGARPNSESAPNTVGEMNNGSQVYGTVFVNLHSSRTALAATVARTTNTLFKNCGFFGVNKVHDLTATPLGDGSPTYINCLSDANDGPLPSGVTAAALSTANFVSITNGAGNYDLRLPAGSALIGAGIADTTHAATDITGRVRATSGAIDVGPWQT